MGQPPAGAVSRDLGITTHAHQHSGALAWQGDALRRLAGSFKHQRLLRQRLLQIIGRKTQTGQSDIHLLAGCRIGLAGEHAAGQVRGAIALAYTRTDAHNGHHGGRQRCRRCRHRAGKVACCTLCFCQ